LIKKTNRKLSPSEVIDEYPQLNKQFNFLPQDIGRLIRLKILNGYIYSEGSALIQEQSIIDLISFINEQIDKNKIK
jgi:hypothetical protein